MWPFLTGKSSGGKPAFSSMECLDGLPVFILRGELNML